ncbi:FxLYD domain-containing protein [Streptomyces bungoensis]|uniref:FxLYD domain-containing protein n=1 Tax=Streptomyces bungoensis TaxID=285568 RepID=UPI00343CE82D
MAGHRVGNIVAAAVAAGIVAAAATGCSNNSSTSTTSTPSAGASIRSKISSAASAASSAASSLASQASSALASASAEARRKLDEVKGGVDVKGDVKLGAVTIGGDGKATVPVTVHNTAGSTKSFAVQVNFKDRNGNLLDTVVVTVDGVAAGKTADAKATSHRKLSSDVGTTVGTAVRY